MFHEFQHWKIWPGLFVTLFSEDSTHNHARTTRTRIAMFTNPTLSVETRAQNRKRNSDAHAGEAIPGLPTHLVVAHILRSEYFDDPADLARLPAVSSAMRDTMAGTGLCVEELDEETALELGCLSALQRLDRRGHLSREEPFCQAAARGGHLEEMQLMSENGCPWNEYTC